MTVRLPIEHKAHIAHLYVHENESTLSIALKYGVSPRTINRVLVEMGVARTPKIKPKATTVAQPTPVVEPVIEPVQLQIEMFPEQSFLQKSVALFKRIIAKLFSPTHA